MYPSKKFYNFMLQLKNKTGQVGLYGLHCRGAIQEDREYWALPKPVTGRRDQEEAMVIVIVQFRNEFHGLGTFH